MTLIATNDSTKVILPNHPVLVTTWRIKFDACFAQIWLYKHSLLCSSPPSLLLISITMGKCSLLFLCVPFLVFAINLILWWWWVVFAFVVLFWAGENSSAFDVRVPVYTSEEVYVLTFLFFELLLLYSVCWRVSNLIVLGFIRVWW